MALGDIIQAPIQNVRVDFGFPEDGRQPNIEYIAENTFGVSWHGGPIGNNGLRTVSVSNLGVIAFIDAVNMRPGEYYYSQIIPVVGEVYAVPHNEALVSGADGFIDLAQIPDNGVGIAYLNGPASHVYYGQVNMQDPQWAVALGNARHYAMFFSRTTGQGCIQTFKTSPNGLNITNIAYTQFEGAPPNAQDCHAIHIAGDVYAVVYATAAGAGTLTTVSISGNGENFAVLNSIVFQAGGTQHPHIVHHNGDIYVISHPGPLGEMTVTTVSISSDGLTLAVINALNINTWGLYNWILHIRGSNMFVVFYEGPPAGNGRWVTTVDISRDGATLAVHDTNQWGAATLNLRAAHLPDSNIYAQVCQLNGTEAWLSTFEIDSTGPPLVQTDPATEIT